MNYYNEFDPKAAAWLQELINQGLIPAGVVDTRSITEIKPHELPSYTQCHFFAGIGGWSYALQLAGWPADRPVWSGSCPCQPFSVAGKGLAQSDERHLWPVFHELIRECRPDVVFGEQVANAVGKGWLDGVSSDLEATGYACGSAVLGAHSVGAPHIRQRLYWVADATSPRLARAGQGPADRERTNSNSQRQLGVGESSGGCGLGNPKQPGLEGQPRYGNRSGQPGRVEAIPAGPVTEAGAADGLADATGGVAGCGELGLQSVDRRDDGSASVEQFAPWDRSVLLDCKDGKRRRAPVEPAFQPLAHGIPARVVRLRGYGNAIVPQVAAEFVNAYLSCTTQ